MVSCMNRKLLVIATPLKSFPAGGFLRSYNILTQALDLLSQNGIEIELYVPISDLVEFLATQATSNPDVDIDSTIKRIEQELSIFTRYSSTFQRLFPELIELLERGYCSWSKMFSGKLSRVTSFGLIYPNIYLELKRVLETECIRMYVENLHKVNAIYSMNDGIGALRSLYYFSEKLNTNAALMLQATPYIEPKFGIKIFHPKIVPSIYIGRSMKRLIIKIIKTGKLKLLLSVSPAPIVEARSLINYVKKYYVHIYIPKPANAFDPVLLSYRKTKGKRLKAVYFGRLIPDKGLYDLPIIWKIVERTLPEAELHLFGTFQSERYREKFFRIVNMLRLKNVFYQGYVPHGEKLFHRVADAKILIYPSYSDSFSLTVLEAVALGLAVVAYNIPALRHVYRDLPCVRLVPVGDKRRLALEASKILLMADEEYRRLHENRVVKEFIEIHSSWRNVAYSEFSAVLNVLNIGEQDD